MLNYWCQTAGVSRPRGETKLLTICLTVASDCSAPPWATGFSNTTMMLVLLLGVHSYFGCWPYDRRWIRGIILAEATAAGALLAMRPLHIRPLLDLTIGSISSAAVFIGSLMPFGLDPEDPVLTRVLKVRFSPLVRGALNYGF